MPPSLEYTEMKNSGIEWIGAVPNHWNIRTLYQLVSQVKNKNRDLEEQNLLSLSYGKIKRKDINSNEGLLPASFDGYNIVEAGDIVLRLTDLQNDHTSLRVGLATERGIITSAYVTLHPSDIAHSKYLYYLLHAFDIKKGFYGMGAGVRQGLNYGEVKELRIAMPEQEEQDAIVAYLDWQCAQIDSVIGESKASIEEYKQWKSSLIYETVTKGISPEAILKDSNIDWVGMIPAHWETKAIKYLASCNDETLAENTNDDFEFDYIDIGSVQHGKGITQFQSMIFKNAPSRARRIVSAGDVILSTVRTYLKAVAIIEPFEKPQIASTGFAVLKSNGVVPMFLYYAILSNSFISEVEASSVGISYPAINASQVMTFKIPIPADTIEQQAIANYLDKRCSIIDGIISEKELLLVELEAYKQSLIYEVVTGKRKVCTP